MASRFHPDDPETGDPEEFLILQAAYETLSDPSAARHTMPVWKAAEPGALPIFEFSQFVNGIEGETNRRLGILSLLYNHCFGTWWAIEQLTILTDGTCRA